MSLIVTENITLDGVIDATEGWFAPSGDEADVDNSDIEAVVQGHMAEQEALLLGAGRSRRCAATGRTRPVTRPASATT